MLQLFTNEAGVLCHLRRQRENHKLPREVLKYGINKNCCLQSKTVKIVVCKRFGLFAKWERLNT
jgi:hypothetical protein